MLDHFVGEYRRYRLLGEKALAQVPDRALNAVTAPEGNSIAMLVRHMGGNLASRFTNFLTEDGEKPWRERDAEFETRDYTREELATWWARGWDALDAQLAALSDADLEATVRVRGQPLAVHEALCRSLAHIAYHVGQIVLLARTAATGEWVSLSIPKGQSELYNRNPSREKAPR